MGVLLAGVNPKNLILTAGASAGLAQLGLSTSDVIVALVVFVVLGSLTIAGPVVYYLVGGEHAEGPTRLAEGLAGVTQRRSDGSPVPRLRCRPDRERHPAAHQLRAETAPRQLPRMLTALAMTRLKITIDMIACVAIIIFIRRARGMTSVGLKAVAFVNPRYR